MILGEEDHTPDGRWQIRSYVGPYYVSTADLSFEIRDRESLRLVKDFGRKFPGYGYEELLRLNGGRFETMVFDRRAGWGHLKVVRTPWKAAARMHHGEAVAMVAVYAMLSGELWITL